ncbi:MAG: Ig-like domain-containing protein [Solirubrobacterales bacterium]
MNSRIRLLTAVLAACAFLLISAVPALADDYIVITDPATGSTVGPNTWHGIWVLVNFDLDVSPEPYCEMTHGTTTIESTCATFDDSHVPAELPSGETYTFKVTAYHNGNAAVATSVFTVDSTAPVPAISPLANGFTSDNTPTLSFTSPTDAVGASSQCAVTTTEVAPPTDATGATGGATGGTGATGASGVTSCPAPYSSYTAEALADGQYFFWVRMDDQVQNHGDWSHYGFTVDTLPPTVSAALVSTGAATYTNQLRPSFTIDAADLNLDTVACMFDAQPAAGCAVGAYKAPSDLADGGHSLTVTATDKAGNSQSAVVPFIVDTTPPSVAITAPEAGAEVTSNTPDVSLALAGGTAECSFDGAAFAPCDVTGKAPPLKNGAHKLVVRATDLAGNTSNTSAEFTVSDPDQLIDVPTGKFAGSKTKVKKGVFGFALGWRFAINGVPDSDAACHGTAILTFKARTGKSGAVKQTRRVALTPANGQCTAGTLLKLKAKLRGRPATLTLEFSGNEFLKDFKFVKKLRKI